MNLAKIALGVLGSIALASSAWAAPLGYVTLPVEDKIAIFDAEQNKVVGSIQFEAQSLIKGIAVAQKGKLLMVTDRPSNKVLLINAETLNTIAEASVDLPSVVALSPDEKRLYVMSEGIGIAVLSFDSKSIKVLATVPLNVGIVKKVLVNKSGTRLYISSRVTKEGKFVGRITTMDVSGQPQSIKPIGDPVFINSLEAGDLSLNASGDRLYVTESNASTDRIVAIDVTNDANQLINDSIPFDKDSKVSAVVAHPVNPRVYAATEQLNFISSAMEEVLKQTGVLKISDHGGQGPNVLAINSAGTQIYSLNSISNNMTVMDVTGPEPSNTPQFIAKIDLSSTPEQVVLGVNPVCGNKVIEIGEQCDGTLNCKSDCTFFKLKGNACGDGDKTAGEECDDGNLVNGDGCNSFCKVETIECGNGLEELGEDCDDGNLIDGDGCSANCVSEEEPSVCGNGSLEGDEECDDGNLIDGDGCSSTCLIEENAPVCGNQIIENGEECDGANDCTEDCKLIKDASGSGCSLTASSFNVASLAWALLVFPMLGIRSRKRR